MGQEHSVDGLVEQAKVATAALVDAVARHKLAAEAEKAASREETAALNMVNEAQKAVDKVLSEIHALAPFDSDWGRQHRRRLAGG